MNVVWSYFHDTSYSTMMYWEISFVHVVNYVKVSDVMLVHRFREKHVPVFVFYLFFCRCIERVWPMANGDGQTHPPTMRFLLLRIAILIAVKADEISCAPIRAPTSKALVIAYCAISLAAAAAVVAESSEEQCNADDSSQECSTVNSDEDGNGSIIDEECMDEREECKLWSDQGGTCMG